ncbi:MAG: N-6 DNA methylase [Moheibacter sp.]
MSEELLQRDLIKNPEKIGKWDFYNIGATSVKNLKEFGLIRNVDYGKEERKKVDGLIVQKKNVIAIVEYKKPSEFKTVAQKNKAIKQELEVARKLGAHILIATDTKETVWVNVLAGNKIKDENGNLIKDNFDPKGEKTPDLIEKIKYSINELSDQIKPKELVNPTDLAKQIWQDIWSVSGATPENCLYTFVELFIFKYLSDLGVLQGIFNFNTLYSSYDGNTEDEVLETYANTIRPKIKTLFPENPIDKTTIINGTIFVSKDQKAVQGYSTVFKKVLKKFKDYGKLEHIDYDFKSQLFESFLKESISKKNWGQFFTPIKVVRAVVEMAKDDIKVGAKICDPACGVGKFLLEPVITKLDQFYEVKKGKLIPKITIQGYDKGFDKDEQKTIILAKANMLIYFSDLIKENPNLTTEFSKLFNESFILKTNSILGTLSESVENEYDLIVTNPPYVTSGSSNLKDEIKKDGDLVNYYKINAIGVEGLFMEWIVRALKPNGKAFIIVPDGIFNRQNDKNLRQFLLDECYIDGIISLPIKTFFTTPKRTYVLCITKKPDNKSIQTDPVFTYFVSEMGESRDVYRFDIEQDDLNEAVMLYSFFKGNKQNFAKINTDVRCKIQPIEKFQPENHWCVERWWSKEEKEELGIEDENLKLKIEEFPTLLDEVSNSIISIKEEVQELATESEKPKFVKKKIKEIFDLKEKTNNSKFTKTFIDKNKGTIPVYSASKFPENVDYGYVKDNLKGVKYFENCLTWNIDGSIGKVYYRQGKFSLSEKVIPLIVQEQLNKNLDLIYLKYAIEMEFSKHYFGFDNKAGKGKIQDIEISIPIDKKGDFDISKQKELAEKFKRLEDIKKSISDELDKISSTEIDFE